MTGRVTVKNGYWNIIINYKAEDGTYKQHWKKTDLKERGNKKLAEKRLNEEIAEFALKLKESMKNKIKKYKEESETDKTGQMPFESYIKLYTEKVAAVSAVTTVSSYMTIVKVIEEYFVPRKIKLVDVTTTDIIDFFNYLRNERGIKEISVKHYACIIRPALKKAYQDKIIPENPYEFVPKIHKEKYIPTFYNKEEMAMLFKAIEGNEMELELKLLAYYGLRRSELLGLKWDAIDYDHNIIYIKRTLFCPHKTVVVSEKMKTKTSNRTLPLIPEIRKMLEERQVRIQSDKQYFGKGYNMEYDGFVCVNAVGGIVLPDHLTKTFRDLLRNKRLKHIRLHDLRHSCASLMLANGVQMKQIQEWLGHSNYSTTADVYSHLDFSSKIQSAETIAGVLNFSGDQDNKRKRTKEELLKEIQRLQARLAEIQ